MTDVVLSALHVRRVCQLVRSLMMAEGCCKLGSVGFGRWIKE